VYIDIGGGSGGAQREKNIVKYFISFVVGGEPYQ